MTHFYWNEIIVSAFWLKNVFIEGGSEREGVGIFINNPIVAKVSLVTQFHLLVVFVYENKYIPSNNSSALDTCWLVLSNSDPQNVKDVLFLFFSTQEGMHV